MSKPKMDKSNNEAQGSEEMGPGFLKFYMSYTQFFLAGGFKVSLPVDGFHEFVYTHMQFIKLGDPDPGVEDKYGDIFLINASEASSFKGMTTIKIPSIKSRM